MYTNNYNKKLIEILNKTNETESVIINDKREVLNVYEIDFKNINLLKFNPFNTRISDLVISDNNFNKMNEYDLRKSYELQNFIFNNLKKYHKEIDNKRLKQSIIDNGLVKPLICLEDGLLLSGNNRLSILKDLKNENENKIIRVAIYNEKLNKKQIIENELALQNGTDIKLDYDQMSKIIRIGDLKEREYSNLEIAKKMGINQKDVNKNYKIYMLYDNFLFYSNFSRKYDFYRNFNNLYSMLASLENTISKRNVPKGKEEILKEIYFDVILTTNSPVQKFRDHINKILNLTPVKKRDKELNKFIYEINNIIKESLFLAKKINKNSLSIIDDLREIREKSKQNECEKLITNAIDESIKRIKQSENDIKSLKNNIERNFEEFNELIDKNIIEKNKAEKIKSFFKEILSFLENNIYNN